MSPAASPGASGRWRHTITTIAHAQPLLLLIAGAIFTIQSPSFGALQGALLLFAALMMLAGFLCEGAHSTLLCLRCGALTPLDGEAKAKRQRHWLWLHHLARSRWDFAIYAIGLAAANLGVLVLHLPTWATFGPLWVYWAATSYAALRHRPLRPWCSRCQGWGWGDTEVTLSPQPIPGGTQCR